MSQEQDAARCRETAEDIRDFLRGVTGVRSAMYHSFPCNKENVTHLCGLLDAHMCILGKLVGRDWRGFTVVAKFGSTGMHKFMNKEETFEQNRVRLHKWVNEFLDWLDNPLYQMAAALREDDDKIDESV